MIGVADVLLRNLDAAYDRRGWHGPTLRSALRGLNAERVSWRPAGERHNIWELVMHCAYWKHVVRRRLTGGKRGSFARKGTNWFASGEIDEKSWKEVVRVLDDEHRRLRATIAALPKRAFEDAKTTRLVYGAAAHDLYHTGQIQLIKRLQQ